MPRRRAESSKGNKNRNLLFRAALFIVVLLLLRDFGFIGVQQEIQSGSQSTTGGISQGDVQGENKGDSNQVLALMVGPAGPPGPAGVAGKDGFVGLNGYQGKDGIPGAPGAVGEQGPIGPAGPQGVQGLQGLQGAQGAAGAAGAGVVIVALDVGDSNCSAGGTKFISSTGTISYACNGTGGGGFSGGGGGAASKDNLGGGGGGGGGSFDISGVNSIVVTNTTHGYITITVV